MKRDMHHSKSHHNPILQWLIDHDYGRKYFNLPVLQTVDTIHPCFHRDYIRDGYRNQYDINQTILSLFTFHNETMNIWSHLIAFMCVLLSGTALAMEYQAESVPMTERVCMGLYVVCAAICMLLSTAFHWFGCISEKFYYSLLALDLTGVAILIAGSFMPAAYYGFYCTPVLQRLYIGTSCAVLVIGVAVAVLGSSTTLFARRVRLYGFGALSFFGLVPTIHWLMISPVEHQEKLAWGVAAMFFWYSSGFMLLFTRFPECLWPHSYVATHIVPSHTLWHIAVAAATFTWLYQLLDFQTLIQNIGCSSYGDLYDTML